MKAKGEVSVNGRIYPAVSLAGLHPRMWPVLPIVEAAYRHHGLEPMLTAGAECFYWHVKDKCQGFIHGLTSKHPQGLALDFSCRAIPMETVILIQNEIQSKLDALGSCYQVIFESGQPHFHIEWDER